MNLSGILTEGGGQIGVEIDPGMIQKFETYAALLVKWSSGINLTSIRDPQAIAVGHFIDSLTIAKYVEPGCSMLDIGSGAGFPGIPVKICRPSISLVLADSRGKKVFFMREAIRKLGLDKTRAIKARAGEENEKIGAGFDIVAARAVSNIPEIVRLALPLAKEGGVILIMKGGNGAREWEKEKNMIPPDCIKQETAEEITLPVSGDRRFILGLKKTGEKQS